MDKDIAILDVKNCPCKSLSYFKETLPGIKVSLWGFPRRDIEHLPDGRSVENIRIGESPISFMWKEEKLKKGVNKWNKKPEVRIEAFHIKGGFEIGFSGSPVYYNVTKQVVGMLAAKDEKNGYLIPIQTI